jgi:uncharacterized damage-inducible protein DinB
MAIAQALLPEFDHEMEQTRKTLERVPNEKFDWKPHPKSGTMGWLTSHLATLPYWAVMTMMTESFDLAPLEGGPPPDLPRASNRQEALDLFDRNRESAREAIAGATDEHLMTTWRLLKGGKEVLAMPRAAVFRGMVMNHLIHHRGQLSVYLRLNDVPIPALYGPSADEGGF